MAVLVPSKGWCTAVRVTNLAVEYGVMGPLAAGDYLRALYVTVSASAAQSGLFGASLSPSGEGTAVAFRTGSALIQRSPEARFNQPVLAFLTSAGSQWRVRIPVGIAGETGARYVILYLESATEPGLLWMAAGAEVRRLRKRKA